MIIFKVNRLKKKLLIETCTWVSKSVYICHKNNTMKKKQTNKKKKEKTKEKTRAILHMFILHMFNNYNSKIHRVSVFTS